MLNRFLYRGEFTGWHMLAITLLFFGTIITVNVTLVVYANRSWTGLVVENSYVASQHFNELLADRRHQTELGITATLKAEGGSLVVLLAGPRQKPEPGAMVTVRLGRPSHEGSDRTFELAEDRSGSYSAPAQLADGIWSGGIVVKTAGGQGWTEPVRILVRGGGR